MKRREERSSVRRIVRTLMRQINHTTHTHSSPLTLTPERALLDSSVRVRVKTLDTLEARERVNVNAQAQVYTTRTYTHTEECGMGLFMRVDK